jgi:hypothetical protein
VSSDLPYVGARRRRLLQLEDRAGHGPSGKQRTYPVMVGVGERNARTAAGTRRKSSLTGIYPSREVEEGLEFG